MFVLSFFGVALLELLRDEYLLILSNYFLGLILLKYGCWEGDFVLHLICESLDRDERL